MPILPMVSATKNLDKVLCLACDIKHSSFENGEYNICNDTIEHERIEYIENKQNEGIDGNADDFEIKKHTYLPVPFQFNIPSQSETDNTQIAITNIGLGVSKILRSADNSFEDILIHCWMIVGNYDGTCNWLDLGEYTLDTTQVETTESVSGTLVVDNCFEINAGRFRGDNPELFINLNHR